MKLYLVAALLRALAAAAAIALARRRAEARPIAVFLSAMVLAGLARMALVSFILAPERAAMLAGGIDPTAVPFSTARALAAVHVDGALVLLHAAGLAALACYAFTMRPRTWAALAGIAWLLASVALALAYPATRGAVLQRCYLGAQLAALAVVVGTGVSWISRRQSPHVGVVAIILITCSDLAGLVAGPWRRSIFTAWDLAQAMVSTLYVILILLFGGALWRSGSPSKPS